MAAYGVLLGALREARSDLKEDYLRIRRERDELQELLDRCRARCQDLQERVDELERILRDALSGRASIGRDLIVSVLERGARAGQIALGKGIDQEGKKEE